MIYDIDTLHSLIGASAREQTRCRDGALELFAVVGKPVKYTFCDVPITLEVYGQVSNWMYSGLSWEQWLEQQKMYTPTGTIIESTVTEVMSDTNRLLT